MTKDLPDKVVGNMGGWVSAEDLAQELLRCMTSGQYLVLSHPELLEEVKHVWEDFEGNLDMLAKSNARSSPKHKKSNL